MTVPSEPQALKERGESKPQPAETLELVLSSNENYFPGLAVALHSVLAHANQDRCCNVTILDGGLSPSSQTRLPLIGKRAHPRCEIRILPLELSAFQSFPLDYGGSHLAYARLFSPNVLPHLRRIIYLDSDLLVLRDIGELWDSFDWTTPIAAVEDPLIPTIAGDCPNPQALGLNGNEAYFNTGVLMMNLDLWRRDKICDKATRYISENPDGCRWWDQSALNVVLAGQWTALPKTWNVFAKDLALAESPAILHFLTPVKPWMYFHRNEASDLFYETAEAIGVPMSDPRFKRSLVLHRCAAFLVPYYRFKAMVAKSPRKKESLRKRAEHWTGQMRYKHGQAVGRPHKADDNGKTTT